ncbi:hypothetical protein THAOC_37699, partial [Thalassiosira oceanica]
CNSWAGTRAGLAEDKPRRGAKEDPDPYCAGQLSGPCLSQEAKRRRFGRADVGQFDSFLDGVNPGQPTF